MYSIPPANEVCEGYVLHLSVSHSVQRGGGCAWLLEGACVVVRGRAWLQRGMRGLRGDACVGYDEIRSMSGRYASYWNTFLFQSLSPVTRIKNFLGLSTDA